jgi:hypothetical protein
MLKVQNNFYFGRRLISINIPQYFGRNVGAAGRGEGMSKKFAEPIYYSLDVFNTPSCRFFLISS